MRECQCSRITNNYLCNICTSELASLIHRTPWLIRELETTAARLDKTSSGGNLESKTASKSRPDTVNLNATLAAQELLFLTMKYGGDAGRAALDPDGPAHYTRYKTAYEHGINIIDRKPERIHLGTCPTNGCRQALNVIKGDTAHKCQECGETIDIEAHETNRISSALNVTVHPPEAARLLQHMGYKVRPRNIEDRIRRGKVVAVGEVSGRPTYRLADIHAIATKKKTA